MQINKWVNEKIKICLGNCGQVIWTLRASFSLYKNFEGHNSLVFQSLAFCHIDFCYTDTGLKIAFQLTTLTMDRTSNGGPKRL